jgi:hypothetical protein
MKTIGASSKDGFYFTLIGALVSGCVLGYVLWVLDNSKVRNTHFDLIKDILLATASFVLPALLLRLTLKDETKFLVKACVSLLGSMILVGYFSLARLIFLGANNQPVFAEHISPTDSAGTCDE